MITSPGPTRPTRNTFHNQSTHNTTYIHYNYSKSNEGNGEMEKNDYNKIPTREETISNQRGNESRGLLLQPGENSFSAD